VLKKGVSWKGPKLAKNHQKITKKSPKNHQNHKNPQKIPFTLFAGAPLKVFFGPSKNVFFGMLKNRKKDALII